MYITKRTRYCIPIQDVNLQFVALFAFWIVNLMGYLGPAPTSEAQLYII